MLKTTGVCCLLSCVLSACGGAAADQSGAQTLASALKGDAKAVAGDNPQCKLFTPAEVAKFIGRPVKAGENAALGTGCQWEARSGVGNVMIQVVPARYHEPPTAAPTYKKLPDVGRAGFVVQDMGWKAGAITGPEAVVVVISDGASSEANAVALLKETIKRRTP